MSAIARSRSTTLNLKKKDLRCHDDGKLLQTTLFTSFSFFLSFSPSFFLSLPLSLSPPFYRVIALRTEGFQSEDLSVLVNRAIRQSYFRLLVPPKVDSFPPMGKLSVATLTGESVSTLSVSTLTGQSVSSRLPSQFSITFADFATSLEGYVPAALRGLNVHLGTEAGFECVGGLEEAKETLRETLLWPSKVGNVGYP